MKPAQLSSDRSWIGAVLITIGKTVYPILTPFCATLEELDEWCTSFQAALKPRQEDKDSIYYGVKVIEWYSFDLRGSTQSAETLLKSIGIGGFLYEKLKENKTNSAQL